MTAIAATMRSRGVVRFILVSSGRSADVRVPTQLPKHALLLRRLLWRRWWRRWCVALRSRNHRVLLGGWPAEIARLFRAADSALCGRGSRRDRKQDCRQSEHVFHSPTPPVGTLRSARSAGRRPVFADLLRGGGGRVLEGAFAPVVGRAVGGPTAAERHEQGGGVRQTGRLGLDADHRGVQVDLLGIEHDHLVDLSERKLLLNDVETGLCGEFGLDRSLQRAGVGLQASQASATFCIAVMTA